MKNEYARECPKPFQKLINLVNSLPGNADLIYSELKSEYDKEEKSLLEDQATFEARMDLLSLPSKYEKKIEQLFPRKIFYYVIDILEQDLERLTPYSGYVATLKPLEKLFELITIRNLLMQMAKLTLREFNTFHSAPSLTLRPLINFGLDTNGCIKSRVNPMVEIFERYDLPIERIRLCPICENIFWLKRIESPNKTTNTCQKKCSNNFRRRKRQIDIWEEKLEREIWKLEKLRATVAPINPNSKLLIEQKNRVEKIQINIYEAKIKNGNYGILEEAGISKFQQGLSANSREWAIYLNQIK